TVDMALYLFGLCVLGYFSAPYMLHRTPTPTQGGRVDGYGKLGAWMLLIGAFPFLIHLDVDMMLQTKVNATPGSADKSLEELPKTNQPSEKNTNLDRAYRQLPMRIDELPMWAPMWVPMSITYTSLLIHNHQTTGVSRIDTGGSPGETPML
ncbi:hypothetical protein HAX54_043810, partial [Datura stramonium]|nr:hypothetical protein [Datura stramonium]